MTRMWKDLTDYEKGALLLAFHEGKVIDVSLWGKKWEKTIKPSWQPDYYYRVRPEPKLETVTITGDKIFEDGGIWSSVTIGDETHRITFDLIDGEPDCGSIKMEKL